MFLEWVIDSKASLEQLGDEMLFVELGMLVGKDLIRIACWTSNELVR